MLASLASRRRSRSTSESLQSVGSNHYSKESEAKNVPFRASKRDNGDKFTKTCNQKSWIHIFKTWQYSAIPQSSCINGEAEKRNRPIALLPDSGRGWSTVITVAFQGLKRLLNHSWISSNSLSAQHTWGETMYTGKIAACDVKNIHHIPSQFCCIVQRTIISCFWFCWHCSIKLREISIDHAKCSILLNVVNNSSVFTRQFSQQAAKIQWREWI